MSDKAEFRARKIIRDKEKHYIMIKQSVLRRETQLNLENILLNEKRQLQKPRAV